MSLGGDGRYLDSVERLSESAATTATRTFDAKLAASCNSKFSKSFQARHKFTTKLSNVDVQHSAKSPDFDAGLQSYLISAGDAADRSKHPRTARILIPGSNPRPTTDPDATVPFLQRRCRTVAVRPLIFPKSKVTLEVVPGLVPQA